MIWNRRFLIIENCFYATAYCESYRQTMVNLTTICPSKLPGMLIALWHAPFTPSNLSIQRGDQSAFFLLTGHYEWGHSWQQWSVPFRWSPWQRLQTQRERERGKRKRDGECRSTALRSVDPYTSAPLFHSTCYQLTQPACKGAQTLESEYYNPEHFAFGNKLL